MPYIKEERRLGLKNRLEEVAQGVDCKGELTYCIYKLGLEYLQKHGMDYQNISDVCAAMSDSEHEIRRRVLDKYENIKIKQNGDI